MRSSGLTYAMVLALSFLAASADLGEAQAAETEPGWTAISFAGGVSSGSSSAGDTGITLAGVFTYELNPRLALEATGAYLDRGSGADAFDVSGSLLVSLVPSRRDVVPYLAAGGGIYRASFDLGNPRFLGPLANQFGPGTNVCTGTGPVGGTGTCFFGQMPHFYGRRLGSVIVPSTGVFDTRSYTDPVFNFGGGVRIDFGPRVFLRPDARALLVAADGDTYTVGTFTLHVGYRF